jgi:hypothetical protein
MLESPQSERLVTLVTKESGDMGYMSGRLARLSHSTRQPLSSDVLEMLRMSPPSALT